MKQVECNKCGKVFEVEGEWGYCPFCENDNVEVKLPNDLIKATDYDKAKDRIIHEFECINGKFIQHYALGGEHELSTQEIVDCLNALLTIDCDLRTAYAYIKGQKERNKRLEEQLQNAIVPKFKINEEVYIVWHGMVIDVRIKAIGENEYYVDTCHFDLCDGGGDFYNEKEIFKTLEEAESKLKEMMKSE